MLRDAINAGIPLIGVRTEDTVHAPYVLKHVLGIEVLPEPSAYVKSEGKDPAYRGQIYVTDSTDDRDWRAAYKAGNKSDSQLIVLNPPDHALILDAGMLTVPDKLLQKFIRKVTQNDEQNHGIETALRGLSYKDLHEVSKLAMSIHGEFTPASIWAVRRGRMVLANGLRLVDTGQVFYEAPQSLVEWVNFEGILFQRHVHNIIRPRGLLFDGIAGTGKTSGAKFLASHMEIPLYRLDLAGIFQKYVGESEKGIQRALEQIETLSPCVFLLDEIDKLFSNTADDGGATGRVLSTLLWWLQEHSAQVLTVMTTNHAKSIPAELIRPGRIDKVVKFEPLQPDAQVKFCKELVKAVAAATNVKAVADTKVLTNGKPRTQAELTQLVLQTIKTTLVKSIVAKE